MAAFHDRSQPRTFPFFYFSVCLDLVFERTQLHCRICFLSHELQRLVRLLLWAFILYIYMRLQSGSAGNIWKQIECPNYIYHRVCLSFLKAEQNCCESETLEWDVIWVSFPIRTYQASVLYTLPEGLTYAENLNSLFWKNNIQCQMLRVEGCSCCSNKALRKQASLIMHCFWKVHYSRLQIPSSLPKSEVLKKRTPERTPFIFLYSYGPQKLSWKAIAWLYKA